MRHCCCVCDGTSGNAVITGKLLLFCCTGVYKLPGSMLLTQKSLLGHQTEPARKCFNRKKTLLLHFRRWRLRLNSCPISCNTKRQSSTVSLYDSIRQNLSFFFFLFSIYFPPSYLNRLDCVSNRQQQQQQQ